MTDARPLPAAPPPGERFTVDPRRSGRIGAALLAFVGVMALAVPIGPFPLDTWWSDVMTDGYDARLERVALWLDDLGRAPALLVILGVIAAILIRARRWLALAAFALAETASSLLASLLKALLERPRPPAGILHPLSTSFPSGHTAYAGVTCVALVLTFTRPGRRRLWWPAAVAGTCLMGWSRTFLHVHWLSDVVAGGCLGAGVALVAFGLVQRYGSRRR
jgi:membrane-associated phospholipid phosphatase